MESIRKSYDGPAPPLDGDRLLAFVAVARARNFSRAAARLGKTQPSISQAVAALERELGQPLFVRDRRATHLTAAGQALLGHAETVLEEMARARAHLAGLAGLRAGALAVGASDTLACYLLPPVLAAFRRRYPGVELRLDNRPSPATAALVAERALDLGVVTLPLPAALTVAGRPAAESLTVEPLVAHQDVAICAPGHPLLAGRRARAALPIAALAAHPLLLLDRTTGTRAAIDQAFARAGVRPTVAMEMSSVEVLKRLCELGFGVSIVPALAVRREVHAATRTLVALPLTGLPGGRTVALVTPAPGPASPAAAAFAEIARRRLR